MKWSGGVYYDDDRVICQFKKVYCISIVTFTTIEAIEIEHYGILPNIKGCCYNYVKNFLMVFQEDNPNKGQIM